MEFRMLKDSLNSLRDVRTAQLQDTKVFFGVVDRRLVVVQQSWSRQDPRYAHGDAKLAEEK